MRIGLITHQWPGARLGGIGAYTWNCARALVEAGHEPHVFTLTLPEDVRRAIPQGVMMHEVADLGERVGSGALPGAMGAAVHAGGEAVARLAMGALLCAEVRRVHQATPLDVVEGPEYEGLALPLIMAPLPNAPPVALVTQLHSGSAIVRRAAGKSLEGAASDQVLMEAMEAAAMLGADGICAPSHQVVADTSEDNPVVGTRAVVLPLPFYPLESEATDPPANGPVVFIGRLEMVKGAHLLAEALNGFLINCPEARVRIVGPDTASAPGDERNIGGTPMPRSMGKWMRETIDSALLERVEFVGEKTRSELGRELAAASFCVAPSLFDSYSYVCCESLAAGRAVIVSSGIGATEVVGKAGVVFERGSSEALAHAMEQLWRDRDEIVRLGRMARERGRGVLSAKASMEARVAFYQQVASEMRSQRATRERLENMNPAYTAALIGALSRLTSFIAGEPDGSIRTPGMRLKAILDSHGTGSKAWLYGAGRHTSRLLAERHLWEQAGHKVVGLIDDHPRFQKTKEHMGLPVISRGEAEARQWGSEVVVLSTDTFEEQFWEQMAGVRARGGRVFRLYGG